jgi:DNA-directed RNA polymerase subunit RPC12/RpoP
MTAFESPQIPLKEAYLCAECNTIASVAEHCPHCASKSVLPLRAVLNRTQTPAQNPKRNR